MVNDGMWIVKWIQKLFTAKRDVIHEDPGNSDKNTCSNLERDFSFLFPFRSLIYSNKT